MPFTFSHPAIVLPGYYLPLRWRSLTGLVAGSVVPDFEMFFRMEAKISYSHTWHSIFWFNLPLGIVLTFLFHLVVRNSLIDHLPLFLRRRLITFKSFDWTRHFRQYAFVVVLSTFFGILSHFFWDHFTHHYGIFVEWFPDLAEQVTLGGYQTPLYFLLQIGFSFIGGIVILYAILKLSAIQTAAKNHQILKYWLGIAGISFLVTVARYISGVNFNYFPNVIVVLISAGLVSLLITPFLIRAK
jgi:MFS family permease